MKDNRIAVLMGEIMNNLEYFKEKLNAKSPQHTLAHCIAETGKCFLQMFNIEQDQFFKCNRQGVASEMDRYFICRKCIKEWLER